MKVAAVQAAPVFLDTAATLDKVLRLTGEAADAGASVVAFPEVFLSGYPNWIRVEAVGTNDAKLALGQAAYLKSAVDASGPELAAVARLSAELGVFVYLGFVERNGSGGSVYCSLAAIDPKRGVVSVHRKLKPTFHERLAWADGDGQGLVVHEHRGVRVGGLNCFENWLPLARHSLYAQGEQVHIAVWPGDRADCDPVSRFVAMEGRVYVVSASGVLRPRDIPDSFPLRGELVAGRGPDDLINEGGSMIVAPDGEMLAGPVVGEEVILYADVDVERIAAAHLKLDPAGHYSRNDVLRLTVNRERLDPPR